MSAHTPGPWRCAGGIGMGYAVVEDATHTQITGVLDINANARLIAAAPELLEALHDAAEEMDAWMLERSPTADDIDTMRAKFRAVIAKAGEPRTVARLEER